MTKKWVFETIVHNDKDAVGLIAYALYKNKKHSLAASLRKDGQPEEYIQQQVNIFHDQTLLNDTLQNYRDQAENYLNSIFTEIESSIRSSHDEELDRLKKHHKKELVKQKSTIFKKIGEYQHDNRSWRQRLFEWLLSGIPGIVSSFLITCLLLGAASLMLSENKRKEIFIELATEYLGVSQPLPGTPVTAPQPSLPALQPPTP